MGSGAGCRWPGVVVERAGRVGAYQVAFLAILSRERDGPVADESTRVKPADVPCEGRVVGVERATSGPCRRCSAAVP